MVVATYRAECLALTSGRIGGDCHTMVRLGGEMTMPRRGTKERDINRHTGLRYGQKKPAIADSNTETWPTTGVQKIPTVDGRTTTGITGQMESTYHRAAGSMKQSVLARWHREEMRNASRKPETDDDVS